MLRRLPDGSRPRFLRSGLSLVASLLKPKDEHAREDEEAEEDDMDDEEVPPVREPIAPFIQWFVHSPARVQTEGEPTTAVKVTNAFGDTDDDLKRKYRLAPETETLTKAALELVRPFAAKGGTQVRTVVPPSCPPFGVIR